MHLALLLGHFQTMTSAWGSFSQSAATMLVTSIWQGAAIVCGLEVAMRLVPRVSAAHRFPAWAAGFGLAAGMPLLPLLHLGISAGTGSAPAFNSAGNASNALFQLDARWGLAITTVWVIASLIRAAGLAVHSVRLRRLWKTARPVNVNESLAASIHDLRGGRVKICTTEKLDRPSVIGFFAPRILIPHWLIERVTPGELEQIVLHEAEHLRRRDDWTNLLQKLCLVLFPLNPALAWIELRLCREREIACDEGVVRITHAPRAYAACLASLAERRLERRAEALSLGAWHRRSELVHRVHQILARKHGMSRTATGALLGTIGCMLIAGSVEMARCPQLVAFVPRQNDLAMTPERQQQLAELLSRENADAGMLLPPSFHAVQAKAVLHPAQQLIPASSFKRVTRKSSNDPREKHIVSNAEQIAKAERSGDRVNRDPNQQWVVLAALEEVQTVSRSTVLSSDYPLNAETVGENGQAIPSTSSAAGAVKRKTAGLTKANETPNADGMEKRYTITRLLLRVVPANPGSSQPLSMHGGWIVFQL